MLYLPSRRLRYLIQEPNRTMNYVLAQRLMSASKTNHSGSFMRRDMFSYPFFQSQCFDRFLVVESDGAANIVVAHMIVNSKTNHRSDSLMLRDGIVELHREDVLTALVDELLDTFCQREIVLLV